MAKIALWLLAVAVLPSHARADDPPAPGVRELRALAEKNPKRWELWVQISDLESQDDQPAKAAADMARAVEQRPQDLELLKKHAQLAGWASDNAAAERSYRAIVRLDPKDFDSLYLLAQVLSWESRTAEALRLVRVYLIHRPKDAKALLFLGQLSSWNGDSAGAQEAMERYRQLAGDDKAYTESAVRQLADSGEDSATIAAAHAGLKKFPDDCDLYTVKASAESSARRWSGMDDSLANARKFCSDKAASAEQSRRLGTPLRSSIRAGFSYATDSDGVNVENYETEGRYRVNTATFLMLGGEGGWLSAAPNTLFVPNNQNSRVGLYGGWAGLERMVFDKLWVTGRAGYRTDDHRDDTVLGKANIDYRPVDGLELSDDVSHDIYAVSPKSVSAKIRAIDETLHGALRLARRTTLYWDAGYSSYSDHNFRWTVTAAPKQNVITSEKLNVDLGISAKLTSYHDPNNGTTGGYYSPNRYRQYLGTLQASYAFDADDTLSAGADVGAVEDESQPHYGLSNDYSVEFAFGLYRGWMLNPRADFINDLGGVGGTSVSYHRQQYSISLTKRF